MTAHAFRRTPLPAPLLLAAVVIAACDSPDSPEFEPPDRAERVEAAEALYSSALFDSLEWQDDLARSRAGNEVFASKCRNCHGTTGDGGTEYASRRSLTVPSLVEPDWRYAESIDSVRHRVFVGHELGMPTWGVAGISPREIDAAAYYLLERLRPEVIGN